jgi:hypothetical protein
MALASGGQAAVKQPPMILAAVTLFCASALLFVVQPMTGRQVLPWLGGTPAVWTTCMLFFQVVLVAAYTYAHAAPRWFGERHTRWHLLVLAAPLLTWLVPWAPDAASFAGSSAVLGLLLHLTTTVGLPFFALATTSPLVQHWSAPSVRNPFVLFAASNAGSLCGLLVYPLWLEPTLRLGEQRAVWTVGYGLVAVAIATCGIRARPAVGAATVVEAAAVAAGPITIRQRTNWLLLAFVPSSLLLAVTTHVTTNLAPVPLLWVIPLALYLLTFVVAFGWPRTVEPEQAPAPGKRAPNRSMLPRWLPPFLRWQESPWPAAAILPVALLPLVVLFFWERAAHGPLLLLLHLATFLLVGLALHGRLAAERPNAAHLTEYYLWIAFGGACGGIANGLVAPFVFPAMVEYPLGLAAACLLLPWPAHRRTDGLVGGAIGLVAVGLALLRPGGDDARFVVLGVPAALALLAADRPVRLFVPVAAMLAVGAWLDDPGAEVLHRARSVFGAHRVERLDADKTCLVHGNILHGVQDHRPERRREPLTYYHRSGPCGELLAALAGRIPNGRVGAVGLGIGSVAAYGRAGERWTFFEIDAAVERTAREQFTFLADSAAVVDVRIGDGRIGVAGARDGEFGLLVLDAFNSDAVPVHLLTREALAVYGTKLAPGGVLAFHVSSRYVDLVPVLGDLAADGGWVAKVRREAELPAEALAEGRRASKWIVLARRADDLGGLDWEVVAPSGGAVWTDDHSSLLSTLRLLR